MDAIKGFFDEYKEQLADLFDTIKAAIIRIFKTIFDQEVAAEETTPAE